jgi:hypothetical protein
MVAVFQHGWGAALLGTTAPGAIESWIPLFVFVVLFGLSMDYNVFVVSRTATVLRPRPLRPAPDDVRLRPESPTDRRCRRRRGGRDQDSEEVPGPAGQILIGRPVLAGYLGRERAARFSSGI